MAKRKQARDSTTDGKPTNDVQAESSGDSGDDEEMDMLNVDFEWFDPQPEHDFHGLKTLLRQLFDVDAQLFDLSALTDLILSQPLLGSTVKVDGNETDPYAFLTVLNLHTHRDKPVIQALRSYLHSKCSASTPLSHLAGLLSSESTAQVGLVLTERLINIPAEVVPPMYAMLLEEISWALEEKEPYQFSHYLILSKTFTEIESSVDQVQEDRPSKKTKKSKTANGSSETFYFHPEDEVLRRHALEHGPFEYTRQDAEGVPDSKRAFQDLGIRPQGLLMLIEASNFEAAVKDVEKFLGAAS
ncbi:MAG: Mss4p nuclear export [Peltula sp. TS41687]|nr:MAG: Mss4p nuclear export [Peltula sp. TS41687]